MYEQKAVKKSSYLVKSTYFDDYIGILFLSYIYVSQLIIHGKVVCSFR